MIRGFFIWSWILIEAIVTSVWKAFWITRKKVKSHRR